MNSSIIIGKIAKALLEAQKEMGDATKNSKNPFYESSYAGLNSIRETVTPALNAHGVSILQPTLTLGDKNFVETILLHESGEFISGITEIKNTDGKPQSEGSGISYARRYGLQSILNVGAVDDDGEAAQGRNSTKQVEVKQEAKPTIAQRVASKTAHAIAADDAKETVSTKDLITKAFKVLEAQKVISAEAFKMNYLGNKGISTIAPSELFAVYLKMNKDFPQLTNGAN